MRRILLILLLLAGPAHAGEAEPLLLQGVAHYDAGRDPQALVALSRALSAARGEGDLPAQSSALAALGRVHRRLGRHADGLRLFEEALTLDRQRKDAVAVGADLVELGLSQRLLGAHGKARRLLRQAFESFQGAGDPLGAAGALTNLGLVLGEAGRPDRALEPLHQALRLYTAAGDERGQGDAGTDLGVALADLGRYADAISAQRDAIDAFVRADDPAGQGAALHNLSGVYARLGDAEQAAALLRQARPLLTRPAERAASDRALADLLVASGHLDEAEELLRAALAEAPADARAGLPEAARALLDDIAPNPRTDLAVALVRGEAALPDDPAAAARHFGEALRLARQRRSVDGQWRALHGQARARGGPAALPLLREAVALAESDSAALGRLSPAARRALIRSRAALYRDLIDAELQAGEPAAALLYSERLRRAELRPPPGPPADASEAELRAFEQRQRVLQDALSDAQGERAAALDTELAQLRQDFSAFVDHLRHDQPDLASRVRVDPADLEVWQRELRPDEMLLQPILLPDRLVLLIFTRERQRAEVVAVGEEELERRLGSVVKTLRRQRLGNLARLQEHLDALGGWLLAPAGDELATHERVIVAPAGALRYLNFAMLRYEGRYLVATHAITHISDVGSLRRTAADELQLRGDGLLAFGNPDGTLPAADAEVDLLGNLFPGARVLHGPDATLDRLRAEAPHRDVLHLATHDVLDASAPERSHVVLASGALPYGQIPGLHGVLGDAKLVVLSACESAVPVSAEGDVDGEGVEIAGLAWQFRRAGVPRLVASLWKVSDRSTSALMEAFYRNLGQGRSPPEALAAAQRALLSDPNLAHPFHWAPFLLMGTP